MVDVGKALTYTRTLTYNGKAHQRGLFLRFPMVMKAALGQTELP